MKSPTLFVGCLNGLPALALTGIEYVSKIFQSLINECKHELRGVVTLTSWKRTQSRASLRRCNRFLISAIVFRPISFNMQLGCWIDLHWVEAFNVWAIASTAAWKFVIEEYLRLLEVNVIMPIKNLLYQHLTEIQKVFSLLVEDAIWSELVSAIFPDKQGKLNFYQGDNFCEQGTPYSFKAAKLVDHNVKLKVLKILL